MNKGFTLIEIVMSIVLLGIIGVMTTGILVEAVDSWLLVEPRKEGMQGLRISMERMVREMREGRRYDYTRTSSSNLTFRQYSSGEAVSMKTITYSLSGSDLVRTEGAVPNVLASDIVFLNFSVYQPNTIRILMRSTVADRTVELRDAVFFRNYTGRE